MQRRDRGVGQSLGGHLLRKVKESRVLLVGAGGIGCELLKNLVCCGFGSWDNRRASTTGNEGSTSGSATAVTTRPEIVVIDLDTIDLSNLNRQFLFRKHHIKKPKASVAKETASQFNPSARIDAHHANIFDAQYDVEFFEGFDVVFNALDNLAARRHVNKMCLAANVPLIESGTTGFNGQVQVIKKGESQCYDCDPKPIQKSFPICTIRSTPSQPIHCIVWAKSYLFPELFGTSEEDSADISVTEGDNVDEVVKLKEEAEALKKIRSMMGKSEFAQEVFNKVFYDDIERLRSMEEMWQSRTKPESLHFDATTTDSNIIQQGQAKATEDQVKWNLLENISVFCYSLEALSSRIQTGNEAAIEFDKDDKDTLDFVASAANLRSHIFGIPIQSEWEIKKMAGNIIPAIATSNALTASLCALEAFKILRSQAPKANAPAKPATNNRLSTHVQGANSGKGEVLLGGAKTVFLQSRSTERMIASEALAPPRSDCPVCSPVYAKVNLPEGGDPKLQDVVDLLRDKLGYDEFSITANDLFIYDPDLEDNLEKSLSEQSIGVKGNSFITITDESDEPRVDLLLSMKTQSTPADENAASRIQLLPENIELPSKPKTEKPNGQANGIVTSEPAEAPQSGSKRKREASEELVERVKRSKAEGQQDVLVVEDDGAILIDDD